MGGMLEGMQIAFFAVAKLPASSRGTSFFGQKTCDLLFKGNGENLPGFMIGRQLTVVASFFLVGSITSMNITPGTGENIFGVLTAPRPSLTTDSREPSSRPS